MLLLAVLIHLSLLLLMYFLYPCIDASTHSLMLVSSLQLSFLSILSLRFQALCIVINFLVFWFICLSCSLVYFKNGPEWLTRGTDQLFFFFPLIRFLLQNLVLRSFLVLLRLSFLFFFFHPCCCCYYFTLLRVFHTNVSLWFFTGVWVTESLLNSSRLFSVFWPILVMLYVVYLLSDF